MTSSTSSFDTPAPFAVSEGVMVSFAERFAASDQFDQIFKEGMALVEKTAAYLDGPGRKEAKGLPAPLTLVYATESMRLTTRLLELASWLLIRRGLKNGEFDVEEASRRRQRLSLQPVARASHVRGYGELPQGLRELIDQSFQLNDRILSLDRALNPPRAIDGIPAAPVNPVDQHVAKLHAAFGGGLRVVGGRS
jgi:regulator of CtrA degradation